MTETLSFKRRVVCAVMLWIAVVFWMLLIYSMSADTGEESGNKSGEVVDFVAGVVVPEYEEMTPTEKDEVRGKLSFPIRKLAHLTEYAVLGVLCCAAVSFTPKLDRAYMNLWLPVIIGSVYAATDEYHQASVPGRGPALSDVGIDTAGVILGVTAMLILFRMLNKKTA